MECGNVKPGTWSTKMCLAAMHEHPDESIYHSFLRLRRTTFVEYCWLPHLYCTLATALMAAECGNDETEEGDKPQEAPSSPPSSTISDDDDDDGGK